jgi:RNA polymerase sigma-70 factor, ECF subfamily
MLTVDPDMAQDTVGRTGAPPPEAFGSGSDSDAQDAVVSTDWISLVEKIKDGSEAGMTDLYRLFSKGIRFYLCRQLGPQELDDKVHDTFLIVVQAIRRGDLREPERLMGFVRTVVRRQVAAYIDEAVQCRREQADIESGVIVVDGKRNPEEKAIGRQNEDLMVQVLRIMSSRDREILTRFYLHEQTQEQICADMKLSETQFRLLKSRAKARFGELGRRKLQKRPAGSNFVRTMASVVHSVY